MKPFLKWAGGKSGMIGRLSQAFRHINCKTLVEPFVGGGSVFISLHDKFETLKLNDLNSSLMNCYINIRDNLDELWEIYSRLANTYWKTAQKETMYYRIRELYNRGSVNKVEKAACFILLNKTCFNGLYRLNKQGEFNVAWGKQETPSFASRDELSEIRGILGKAKITSTDFAELEYGQDDLVYFDPPYQPLTGNFTTYTQTGFDFNDQIRLKNLILELDKRGISIVMSNSNFFEIKQWFPAEWIRFVEASRSISQEGTGRNSVKEVLVSNRWRS